MLRSLREILGYDIQATDDGLGDVDDFLFDDHTWTVRYVVIDTGHWLPGRLVLVSPVEMDRLEWDQQEMHLKLSKQQIEEAPSLDTDLPVSRQHEMELVQYYGWVPYWAPMGGVPAPAPTAAPAAAEGKPREKRKGDPNLRSAKEVIGYHIQARDGEIGHVEDFIADTDSWTIRYMAIDTRNWLPGRKVLVSPDWVARMDWGNNLVHVDHTRDEIKHSPEYDPDQPVNRRYERALYDYYGRRHYWEE